MKLLHYSKHPFLGPVLDTDQQHDLKPAGLWVSVAGPIDWPEWCHANSFMLDNLAFVSEIILQPRAKVLRLSSAADIDRLTEDHRLPARSGHFLNWRTVAERYDGIIIAPYQWSRRLAAHTSWYYVWDCASGCIWRTRAVADVRPAKETGR